MELEPHLTCDAVGVITEKRKRLISCQTEGEGGGRKVGGRRQASMTPWVRYRFIASEIPGGRQGWVSGRWP